MCKLAAMVNLEPATDVTITNALNKFLDHIFYINSFGQQDGSGVMWMDKEGNYSYHKRAINSVDFIESRWWANQSLATKRFVGLHTRYATQGGINDANAHPFEHGDFLLMQNGTAGFTPHHTNLVPGKYSGCAVDSESVCWSFAEQGVQPTLEAYRGDGVFMFMNTRLKTFNIIKNDKRDLHIIQVTGKNIFLYATDAHALALAATRAGLPFGKVKVVANDMWHVFSINGSYHRDETVSVKKYVPPAITYPTPNRKAGTTTKLIGGISNRKYKPTKFPTTYTIYEGDCCTCGNPVYSGGTNQAYKGTTYAKEVCCESCVPLANELFHDTFTLIKE